MLGTRIHFSPVPPATMKRESLTPPSSVESVVHGETLYQAHATDDYGGDDAPLDFSVRKTRRRDSVDDLGSDGADDINSHSSESGSQSESSGTSHGTETPPQHSMRHLTSPRIKTEPVSPGPGDLAIKTGESHVAYPEAVPGAVFPDMESRSPLISAASPVMLPGNPGFFGALPLAANIVEAARNQHNNMMKHTRPFKAYPKDPLSMPLGYYGLPNALNGMPMLPMDPAAARAAGVNAEELFNRYKQLIMGQAGDAWKKESSPDRERELASPNSEDDDDDMDLSSRSLSAEIPMSSSSRSSGNPSPPMSLLPTMSGRLPGQKHSYSLSGLTTPSRKKPRVLPDERKDAAYWERRRKNNEAAKRSRDARRAKEDEIAIRAAFLEQENLKLRVEVTALKNETAKLRCMLYNS